MRKVIPIVGFLIVLLTLFPIPTVRAASGLPDSPQFGYGTRIKLNSYPSDEANQAFAQQLQSTAQIGLDWIALDFDWAAYAPHQAEINLAPFDTLMARATENGLNVLISITNAPAWSLSASGPDPAATTGLIMTLAQRYPGTLQAIECFPAANMVQGWGATPNPQAYAQLLQNAQASLLANQMMVTLIAAGLTPLSSTPQPGDMDDAAFLRAIYQAGGRDSMPVISLRLPNLSGEPLSSPANDGSYPLRHFEAIRQVMIENGHERGLLWITAFAWPQGYADQEQQAQWLVQAYELLQSRLYMGAAFFDALNPNGNGASLVAPGGSHHPGLISLNQLIASRRGTSPMQMTATLKKIILRIDFKHP